jgi:hypothetical protein
MPTDAELRDALQRVTRLHDDIEVDMWSGHERSAIASDRHAVLKRLASWRRAGVQFELPETLSRLVDAYARVRG